MMNETQEIITWLERRRKRIDRAANDIIVNSDKFHRYEHAVRKLDKAIVACEQAIKHFQDAHSDTIVWELDRLCCR